MERQVPQKSISGRPGLPPRARTTAEHLQVLLSRIIKRLMRLLTRQGYLVEEEGMIPRELRPHCSVSGRCS
jgi:hypothetical protein